MYIHRISSIKRSAHIELKGDEGELEVWRNKENSSLPIEEMMLMGKPIGSTNYIALARVREINLAA